MVKTEEIFVIITEGTKLFCFLSFTSSGIQNICLFLNINYLIPFMSSLKIYCNYDIIWIFRILESCAEHVNKRIKCCKYIENITFHTYQLVDIALMLNIDNMKVIYIPSKTIRLKILYLIDNSNNKYWATMSTFHHYYSQNPAKVIQRTLIFQQNCLQQMNCLADHLQGI